ncbi:calcium-binding protein [Bauldia litoralis]|uniref:Ca2+-binding protein, RTX toxin-related n=1 Tax=Bauldia litoralis TaxID=665467 RepID=A0A1G6DLN4_9HYPH|nr:calcium-binding protein [Bauldia litoralis]SDB46048.1 Ca2+-binding protein, RTX toxin-related [Bauldia litoralis]
MVNVTGTNANEKINTGFVSPTVLGMPGAGIDLIRAKGGNDKVSAGPGNDDVRLGGGNDTFTWNLGDGDDVVNGQGGNDTFKFNGSMGDDYAFIDQFDGKLSFFDHPFNPVGTELKSIEKVKIDLREGEDLAFVDDLSGTSVTKVIIDLSRTPGKAPDGETDVIAARGSGGRDDISVLATANGFKVLGLDVDVKVKHIDKGMDAVALKGLGGKDTLDASGLPKNYLQVELDGGTGKDTLIGSKGDDDLYGGKGNDSIDGGKGDDDIYGDDGKDTIDGGKGGDLIEGGAGDDRIDGNKGGDLISGGLGRDIMTGGKGADGFYFKEDYALDQTDVIRDFEVGKDIIYLSAAWFPELGATVDSAEFATGSAALLASHRLIYNDQNGILSYDKDGVGGAAAVEIAKIGKGLALSYLDFEMAA